MSFLKKLRTRKNSSRKFLSNLILVKNNIPQRIINYYELYQNLEINDKAVTVVGLGYVGMTLSLALADVGLKVFGYDNNKRIINRLREGKIDIHEIGLDRLLKEHINKSFIPSNTLKDTADIFIICVSTPIKKDSNKKVFYKFKFHQRCSKKYL